MKVADVMTTDVATVGPDVDVQEIARLLLSRNISGVPVVDAEGRPLGLVSEGDLMRRAEAGTEHRRSWWLDLIQSGERRSDQYVKEHGRRAEEIMSSQVVSIGEDASLEAAELLEKHRVKRLPVLRDARVVGIISRANLLRGLVAARPETPAPHADDRSIREDVLHRLGRGRALGGMIDVVVHQGVVQLWGVRPKRARRNAPGVVAAENAPGVVRMDSCLGRLSALRLGHLSGTSAALSMHMRDGLDPALPEDQGQSDPVARLEPPPQAAQFHPQVGAVEVEGLLLQHGETVGRARGLSFGRDQQEARLRRLRLHARQPDRPAAGVVEQEADAGVPARLGGAGGRMLDGDAFGAVGRVVGADVLRDERREGGERRGNQPDGAAAGGMAHHDRPPMTAGSRAGRGAAADAAGRRAPVCDRKPSSSA
jgi:CBS domain-containing protein